MQQQWTVQGRNFGLKSGVPIKEKENVEVERVYLPYPSWDSGGVGAPLVESGVTGRSIPRHQTIPGVILG